MMLNEGLVHTIYLTMSCLKAYLMSESELEKLLSNEL